MISACRPANSVCRSSIRHRGFLAVYYNQCFLSFDPTHVLLPLVRVRTCTPSSRRRQSGPTRILLLICSCTPERWWQLRCFVHETPSRSSRFTLQLRKAQCSFPQSSDASPGSCISPLYSVDLIIPATAPASMVIPCARAKCKPRISHLSVLRHTWF